MFDHCQVLVDGRVVVAGGRLGSEVTGKTWVLEDNIWVEAWSMSTARNFHACTEFSGKLYSIGGETADGTVLASVEVYDPTTRLWSGGPQLPVGVTKAQAITFEGSIYVLAGRRKGSSNLAVFRLSEDQGDWETLPGVEVEDSYRAVFPAVVATRNLINCL